MKYLHRTANLLCLCFCVLATASAQAQTDASPESVKALVAQLSPAGTDAAVQARTSLERIVANAGRPGAEAEKSAAAATLAQCLTSDYPEETRREVLVMLAWVAGDAELPAIAALLPDPVLGEPARECLERIPCEKSSVALFDALSGAKDEMRLLIAGSLGRKKAYGLGPALAERGRSENIARQWPYAEALAKLGVPPMSLGDPGLTEKVFGGQESYIDTAITAAEVCAAQNDPKKALQICTFIARINPAAPEAARVLRVLTKAKSEDLARFALGYMEMPGVRDVAIESLATAEAPGIEENLEKAYKVVDLSRRTAIIEIFARRNSPQLKPLLESGATDPIPEIRITIASVKGEAPKTEDLYLVATKGIIWMREKAIDRYLNAAEELVAAGKPDEARPLFENAAKTDFPAMVRIRALDGLAKTGTRDSLSVVMQCATEADLEAAAKAAEAAIAGRAGK